MPSKTFIDWNSNHILKNNDDFQFSEYRSYDTCYSLEKYSFKIPDEYLSYVSSFLIEPVDENCIYSTGSKVCYFDGNILQFGMKELYNMRKLMDNIYCCENIFLIVDTNILHLLKLHQLKEFETEIENYYPLTELLFSCANNWVKLYKWKTLYDKICKIRIEKDCPVVTGWLNKKMEQSLLMQPLKNML